MTTIDTLKEAHAAGAWIFGIEHDGRLHHIFDPEWACPPDRYLAMIPFADVKPMIDSVAELEAKARAVLAALEAWHDPQ